MKNLLLVILLVLAAFGCGTSFLLLRMPRSGIAKLIVKNLAAAESSAPAVAPVAAPEQPTAATPEFGPEPPKTEAPEDDGKAWKGLSEDNWYAGKRLSESDFDGKVVLVYVWSSKEKPSVAMLSRIEEIWSSFKDKPLVVLGSHRGGRNPKIPNACRRLELTFPMYEGAGFGKEPTVSRYPYIYVVNHHGKVVCRGSSDRSATEALVNALTACLLKQ